MDLGPQFNPSVGNEKDKKKLLKQLGKSFHEKDLEWLNNPSIKVERTTISPSQIDWDHRETWAATHEPKKVAKDRKKIKHGDEKPVIAVNRPHKDDLFIMDGHHHAEAYTQLDVKKIPSYVIHVPRTNGPWDELHSKQERNENA